MIGFVANNSVTSGSLHPSEAATNGGSLCLLHDRAEVGSGTLVNEVARSYDAFNQLAEDAQSHSGAVDGSTPKVAYSYANGTANTTRRLSITYPSGKLVTMNYGAASSADDRLSRLAAVSLDGEGSALGEFTWMGAGRLVELSMPQPGLALSYRHASGEPAGDGGDPYSGYDRFGRTVDMRWLKILSAESVQSVDRIQYGYDRMNRRLWRQDLAAPAETKQDRFYGYDGLGQVTDSALGNLNINRTAIAGVPAEKETFDYDSIGNWQHYLRQAEGVTTLDQTRWNNRDNQLTALNADANGLAYDAAGNMTACRPDKDGDWTKGYTMVWDAWNRLVAVRSAGTNAEITFCTYDGLTRRLTSTSQDVIRHYYYNDVWKCVEERLWSSTDPDRVYYWSGRVGHRDELLRRDRTTSSVLDETLWCLMDYFDPIAVADGGGVVQERYSYSAFGLESILTPAFASRASSDYAWNFLFHGQFRDVDTTGWDNYGYRYYVPWLGRWPSRDPIGISGGANLYGIANNDSPNGLDLLGLCGCANGAEEIPDQFGRKCCPEHLGEVSINVEVQDGIADGHAWVDTDHGDASKGAFGHYPENGKKSSSDDDENKEDKYGKTTRKDDKRKPTSQKVYRACPESKKALQDSIDKNKDQKWDAGNDKNSPNCVGWACQRIKDAGGDPPLDPETLTATPNQLQSAIYNSN